MRSRRSVNPEVAEVARRRLEAWSAELGRSGGDVGAGYVRGGADGGHAAGAGYVGGGDVGSDGVVPTPADRQGPDVPDRREAAEPPPGRHAQRSVGAAESMTGWVQDRLPATLQGRIAMTGSHLVVLALVLAGGLLLTLWWVSRASGQETAVSPVAAGPPAALVSLSASAGPAAAASPAGGATSAGGATAGTAAGGSGSVAASPGASIVVDVAGKVRRPGVATLPSGSRVVDALEAAGGVRRGARLGGLNLARVLTDGEQVLVGVAAAPGAAASAATAPTSAGATPMVDINTATETQLEELPGVGPVTARAILDYRSENGAFTAVDQLLEVSGIGDVTLADLAPYVTL